MAGLLCIKFTTAILRRRDLAVWLEAGASGGLHDPTSSQGVAGSVSLLLNSVTNTVFIPFFLLLLEGTLPSVSPPAFSGWIEHELGECCFKLCTLAKLLQLVGTVYVLFAEETLALLRFLFLP